MAKALLIKSSSPSDQGKTDVWNKLDQPDPFINGIQTGALLDNIDAEVLNFMVSGVPSPWARAKLFGFAFTYGTGEDKGIESGLKKFYKVLLNEWKGFLACLALYPSNIEIKKLELYKSVFEDNELYKVSNAMGRMLFEDIDLWKDNTQNEYETRPFINLIYYKGKLVGGTSPYSLFFTGVSYKDLVNSNELKWFINNKFDDPIKYGNLNKDQLKKLYLLVNNISKNLIKFEETINKHRGGKTPLNLINLRKFLEDLKNEIKGNDASIVDEGLLDGELNFFGHFNPLFKIKRNYYRAGQQILTDVSELKGGYEEIDVQSLLLDNDSIFQISEEEKSIVAEKAALYYLKVISRSNKMLCFPLPLSQEGLELFYNNLSDTLNLVNGKHTLSGYLKDDENTLVVELKLYIDGKYSTPLVREYKIEPFDSLANVILWPNFISCHWNKYYMYSELPSNDPHTQAIPFYKVFTDNEWKIAKDDKGDIFFGYDENYGKNIGNLKTERLVYYPTDKNPDSSFHKYEIITSTSPVAGINLIKSVGGKKKSYGYLITKKPDDESMGNDKIKDYSYTHNPGSITDDKLAVVGIDFGSNNTCISYSLNNVTKPAKFSNRRLFLIGTEIQDPNMEKFAESNEVLFFQNEDTYNGQIKSWIHTHSPLSVPIGMLEREMGAGLPVFEKNIQILEMKEFYMKSNTGMIKYNLKWQNDQENIHVKEGFLKILFLNLCADLYTEGVRPKEIRWSVPGALSKKDVREYTRSYEKVSKFLPYDESENKVKLQDPITEAEAVCNYAFNDGKFGIGADGNRMMVGIDVGGSTSDILLVGKVDGKDKLIKQSSVRLAANKISEILQLSKPLREALHFYVVNPNTSITIKGIDTLRSNPETAPYFMNTIFDRLIKQSDFDSFYDSLFSTKAPGVNKSQVKKIFTIPIFVSGLLLYYAGQLCSKAIKENNLKNVKTVHFYSFGKGGRIFDWLTAFMGSSGEAEKYYQDCFKSGLELDNVDLKMQTDENIRKDNKSEVSKGLSANPKVEILDSEKNSDIIGEDGYIFEGKELNFDENVEPKYLEYMDSKIGLPSEFKQFNRFLNIFLSLIGPKDAALVDNISNLKLDDEFDMKLLNFLNNDKDILNEKRASSNKDDGFEYKHSLLIFEGICYLNNILIKECFNT